MKKLISILMLFAVLLSCCACGGDPAATTDNTGSSTASTEATAPGLSMELTPEQLYGHINQLEPVDGVYKIWSDVGVQNMADHPDAKFELLCNVDMGGAVVSPIGTAETPFTGEINGANFTISNFTLQGGDETDFGFVTVNKGTVEKLLLKDVTFVPGANAANIGSLAGTNEGEISRCEVYGTLNVESAAENASCGGAIGYNTGSFVNSIAEVDLNVTASVSAKVGGIAGTTKGGTIEFIDTNGRLDVTGTNKTVGLFAGEATDIVITSCAFVGASNTVDGVLFTNFTGNEDDERAAVSKGLWRDNDIEPLTENQQKLRDTVVQAMYEMGTVEWTTSQDLRHSCSCQLANCHGVYTAGRSHYGIPYNHKGGSLSRFLYAIDDNGVVEDWVYDMADFDGFDAYIGNDCSTALLQAWYTVSNSAQFIRCTYELPQYGRGALPVGDYNCDFTLSGNYTIQYMQNNDEQTIYESYGKLRKGDAYVYIIDAGGHTRMAAEDAVVVRDQDGLIDPDYSYVISHEQGAHTITETSYTSWRINYKYTFANMYFDTAIPVTCEELVTGEMEPVECSLEGGTDGKAGLVTGTVKANYYLDSVTMLLTDETGATVMDHTLFTTSGRWNDSGHNDALIRILNTEYDMAGFATVLQDYPLTPGQTYHCTVTASLGTGDQIVVKDYSFTNGTA